METVQQILVAHATLDSIAAVREIPVASAASPVDPSASAESTALSVSAGTLATAPRNPSSPSPL